MSNREKCEKDKAKRLERAINELKNSKGFMMIYFDENNDFGLAVGELHPVMCLGMLETAKKVLKNKLPIHSRSDMDESREAMNALIEKTFSDLIKEH